MNYLKFAAVVNTNDNCFLIFLVLTEYLHKHSAQSISHKWNTIQRRKKSKKIQLCPEINFSFLVPIMSCAYFTPARILLSTIKQPDDATCTSFQYRSYCYNYIYFCFCCANWRLTMHEITVDATELSLEQITPNLQQKSVTIEY